jgi:hypothetical protein
MKQLVVNLPRAVADQIRDNEDGSLTVNRRRLKRLRDGA